MLVILRRLLTVIALWCSANKALKRTRTVCFLPHSEALYEVPSPKKVVMIKTKTLHLYAVFVVSIVAGASAFASSTIDGVWKHASKPALIEFNLETGTASIKEHQIHKENVGLTIIKNIVQSPESEIEWIGDMFNGYEDKYVSVTIKLNGQSVSIFDSENNEVLKLLKE